MAGIRNPLTYQVPDSLAVQPGQRVQVPLTTRKALGIVLRTGSPLPPHVEVRPILRLMDAEPVVTPELLELGLWIADYYVAPIGEVFRAMLPLRADTRHARVVRLTELGQRKLREATTPAEEVTDLGADLLTYLGTRGSATVELLRQKFPEAFLQALEKKWVVVEKVERERSQRQVYAVRLAGPMPEKPARLSPVAKRILEALEREDQPATIASFLKRPAQILPHSRDSVPQA